MKSVTREAYGKLNLTLDVLGTRSDGFHEMQMIMQTVSLCDLVTVCLPIDGGWSCTCDVCDVPLGEDNLAWKAAEMFFTVPLMRPDHLQIHIEKHIPMQGGMAGGSADAAAVLHCLNILYQEPYSLSDLLRIAERIGSDVPYCVLGGTALAEGRGEQLTRLRPLPDCYFVLAKPSFSVSTPALFRALDEAGIQSRPETDAALHALANGDLFSLCKCMKNVFQPVLEKEYPVIRDLCEKLIQLGALCACLTGTGSVVFGMFDEEESARKALTALKDCGFTAFLAENV